MKLWDKKILNRAVKLLSSSSTVAQAAQTLSVELKKDVSSDALRSAFQKHGLKSPSSYVSTETVKASGKPKETSYEHYKSYHYDKNADTYYITLKSWSKPLVMKGDDVRAITTSWSNYAGSPATYSELQRKYGMRRQTVVDLLKALELTHTSGLHTDETLEELSEEALVDDALRAKEERVLRTAEKKHWDRINDLAQKAEQFDKFVMDRIARSPISQAPIKPPKIDVPKRKNQNSFSVIATPTDLHVGKQGWIDEVGEAFNIDITRQRLMTRTKMMIEDVLRYGVPEEWIVGAGSDWFHIDNDSGGTTKGTPMDTDGTFARILQEGCRLAEDYIQCLRQVAPVKIVLMAGNHDKVTSLFLTHYLEAVFRSAKDVTVTISPKDRQYIQCGKTLVGITHGDGARLHQLPLLMANEAAVLWSKCPHRAWFTGHLHHQITSEHIGTLVFVMPSLAGTDRWHYRNGYVGQLKSLNAYIVDHVDGVKGILMSVEKRSC